MSEADRQDCAYCLNSPCACAEKELRAREFSQRLSAAQEAELNRNCSDYLAESIRENADRFDWESG